MNFVICDDDISFLQGFKTSLLQLEPKALVSAFSCSEDLFFYLQRESANTDAAFIDIRLTDSNGIDLASKITKTYPDIKLIFITGFGKEYFEEIFLKVRPFAILQKPIKNEYLQKHINEIKISQSTKKQVLKIKINRVEVELTFDKIIYIESDKRKAHIHTESETYTVYEKLDNIQKRLNEDFVRCQKSFIVNLRHVSALDANNFIMTDSKKISISPSKRADVKKKYIEFNFNLLNKTGV